MPLGQRKRAPRRERRDTSKPIEVVWEVLGRGRKEFGLSGEKHNPKLTQAKLGRPCWRTGRVSIQQFLRQQSDEGEKRRVTGAHKENLTKKIMWIIPIICMSLPNDLIFSMLRFKKSMVTCSGAHGVTIIHNSTMCLVYDMLEVLANTCCWYAQITSHGLAVSRCQKALAMLILLMLLLYL